MFFKQMIITGQNLSVSIEYPDYAVSETLLATVDGWERGLRCRKTRPLLGWVLKKEDSIREYVPLAASSIPLFLSVIQLRHATSVGGAVSILAIAIGLGLLGNPLTSFGIRKFYQEASYFKAWTYLLLTTGDSRRQVELTKKKGSGLLQTLLAIFGIFSTVALSVVGNYVFKAMTD